MIIPFIIIMLLLALLIVYFNMSSRVRYLLWIAYLGLYSPHLVTCKIGVITYVSVVLRYVISANARYMLSRVVDHRGYSPIESSVILPPHIVNGRTCVASKVKISILNPS